MVFQKIEANMKNCNFYLNFKILGYKFYDNF